MSQVTLRIVDGPERGKVYNQLPTPVSIGREEGNVVQLNDDRISRYHLKIHENEGTVLLTDLQSTNGTRVNGETIQLWILRPGDLISIGRSVILVGTQAEIARRLAQIRDSDSQVAVQMGSETDDIQFFEGLFESGQEADLASSSQILGDELFRGISPDDLASLHLLAPPEIPKNLSPKQTAQLAEFLQYIHLRLRYLVGTVEQKKEVVRENDPAKITIDSHQWQNLLDLYARLSLYLHSITEPKQ